MMDQTKSDFLPLPNEAVENQQTFGGYTDDML